MKNKMMHTPGPLTYAKVLSAMFRPTYYPTIGFFVLLTTTYLSLLPWSFKLWLLAIVYAFTVLVPWLGTMAYSKLLKLNPHELRHRLNRFVPYILHIISYLCCLSILIKLHLPLFAGAIIVASLLIQVSCVILNIWWKVSMHSAGAGAIIGALVAYSFVLVFNPIWWLAGAILLDGAVMSSRMVLRQHTLGQVLGGSLVGILCGFVGIILC